MHFRLWLPLIAILAMPFACFGALSEIPDCAGPGCGRTPTASEWPAPLTDSAFEVAAGQYLIQLPSYPRRIVHTGGNDLLIFGLDGGVFAFTITTAGSYSDVRMEKNILNESNFSVADAGELIFTQTPDAIPPTDPTDREVWRDALYMKQEIFGESNPVLFSHKGDLTVYYLQDVSESIHAQAYIFDKKNRDAYVKIYAKNVKFDDFSKVIGTISLRRVN